MLIAALLLTSAAAAQIINQRGSSLVSGGGGGTGAPVALIKQTALSQGSSFTVIGKSSLGFDHAMQVLYRYVAGPYSQESDIGLTHTSWFADNDGDPLLSSVLVEDVPIYQGDSLYVRVEVAAADPDTAVALDVVERGYLIDHGVTPSLIATMTKDSDEDGTGFTLAASGTLPVDHSIDLQYRYVPGIVGLDAGQDTTALVTMRYFASNDSTVNAVTAYVDSIGLCHGDSLYVRTTSAFAADSTTAIDAYEAGYLIDNDILTWMWRLDDSPAVAAADSLWAFADSADAAAVGVTYDRVFTDTDGSSIKYGSVYNTAAYFDSIYPNYYLTNHSEYTYNPADTLAASMRLHFIWFDMSELPADCQIESAYLITPAGAAGIANTDASMTQYPAPYGISARLDTISTDLRMLDYTNVRADPSRMNVTYKRPRGGVAGPWTPSFAKRRDWNDFGPRASNTIVTSRTAGQTFRLNLTDAVQQFIDSGRARNGPFVYTLAGASGNNILSVGREFDTNPQFVVRFKETKTRQSPWGNSKIPFVFAFDDAHDEQATFCAALGAAGYPYSLVISGNYAGDGAERLGIDNIMSLYTAGSDIVLHSLTHPDLGGLTDGQIKNQLYRSWWATTLSDATMDSTAVEWQDFAWPVAGGDTYGVSAVKQMIRMGYRSARSAAHNDAWDADVGTFQPYSWSEPFNKYTGATNFAGSRFNKADPDSCRDLLRDYIDEIYSFTGKGAIVGYYHTTDDLAFVQLATLLSVLPEFHDTVQVMSFEDMMTLRLQDADLIDPGTATFRGNNWRRTALATSAAHWATIADSLSATWPDSVWVEGK